MSDDTEKPGVVIDVTPEPEAPTPDEIPQDTQDSPPAASGGNAARLPLIIALLSLLLVIAALVFAYRYTRQASQDLNAINSRLSQSLQQQQALQQQLQAAEQAVREQARRLQAQQGTIEQQQKVLAEARQSMKDQEKLLAGERRHMQEREAELRASVADIHKRVGASGSQWMVAEAEYLLRLANNRLTLARDTATARAALKLADERLRDTGDPGWNGVREKIAQDITALDNARLPDTAGLSARLSALAEQVPQLRLAGATLGGAPRSAPQKPGTTPRARRSWDTLLNDLWTGFKQTVRIRRNDKPVQAMLPPEQQFFLYQNLRLHLESARLAVARGDRKLYRDSLDTVAQWLDSYFDPNDAHTRAMHKAVDELKAIDVRPPLPDISGSLRALTQREKLNADLARPLAPPSAAGNGKDARP